MAAVVVPDTEIVLLDATADFTFSAVGATKERIGQLPPSTPRRFLLAGGRTVMSKPTPEEREEAEISINMLWQIAHRPSANGETIDAWFNAALHTFCDVAKLGVGSVQSKPLVPLRPQEIYSLFCRLLEENGGKERSLSFYADRIGISPKYLSEVVKKESGKTATKLFNEAFEKTATDLLRDASKSATQVSTTMGYANYASFSIAFKKIVGVPPRDYRMGRTGEDGK